MDRNPQRRRSEILERTRGRSAIHTTKSTQKLQRSIRKHFKEAETPELGSRLLDFTYELHWRAHHSALDR